MQLEALSIYEYFFYRKITFGFKSFASVSSKFALEIYLSILLFKEHGVELKGNRG